MKEAFDKDVAFIISYIRGSKEGNDERSGVALERSIACFSVSLGEVTRVMIGGRKNELLVSCRSITAAVCLREMDRIFG